MWGHAPSGKLKFQIRTENMFISITREQIHQARCSMHSCMIPWRGYRSRCSHHSWNSYPPLVYHLFFNCITYISSMGYLQKISTDFNAKVKTQFYHASSYCRFIFNARGCSTWARSLIILTNTLINQISKIGDTSESPHVEASKQISHI